MFSQHLKIAPVPDKGWIGAWLGDGVRVAEEIKV